MKDFYTAFFTLIEHSQVHHTFCERSFGKDLGQHGFADLNQLELLLQVTGLGPAHHALDLGCGNGLIAEYLSDRTGAHVTGLDYIELAINQAKLRTADKADRLAFMIGDINRLDLPKSSFDLVISIDTMYFSDDYVATLRNLKTLLRPNGQMGIFYSYGQEAWQHDDPFRKEKMPPAKTPLAETLIKNELSFRTWDLTDQDYQLAKLRKDVLTELKSQFEAEDAMLIYKNRMGEAESIYHLIENGLYVRYLYLVSLPR